MLDKLLQSFYSQNLKSGAFYNQNVVATDLRSKLNLEALDISSCRGILNPGITRANANDAFLARLFEQLDGLPLDLALLNELPLRVFLQTKIPAGRTPQPWHFDPPNLRCLWGAQYLLVIGGKTKTDVALPFQCKEEDLHQTISSRDFSFLSFPSLTLLSSDAPFLHRRGFAEEDEEKRVGVAWSPTFLRD